MNAIMRLPGMFRLTLLLVFALMLLLELGVRQSARALQSLPDSSDTIPVHLDTDARLSLPLTLDATGIQLDELLHKVSSKELTLTAGRNCAAQKLQIHLKQSSLRILMQSLAELLPGVWLARKDNSGYDLYLATKAEHQRQDWWRLFGSEHEKSLQAYRDYLLNQMRAKLSIGNDSDLSPEQSAQLAAAHDLFGELPQELQERIAGQLNDSVFYGMDRVGFGSGDIEGAAAVNWNELPKAARDRMADFIFNWVQKGLHKEPTTINWSGLQVLFANGGIAVQVNVVLPTGEWTGTPMGRSFEYPPPNIVALTPGLPGLMESVQRLGKDAPDNWKRLATYQQGRVWKNEVPAHPRRRGSRSPLRSEVLQWLSEKADIQFVADYYAQPRQPMQKQEKTAPLTQPLKEALDLAADEQHMSWKQHSDKVYLFRNNFWFRDDYLEVPNALLRRWLAAHPRLEQRTASTVSLAERNKQLLNWTSEVVTQLTPWQIATGLRYFTPVDAVTSGLPAAAGINPDGLPDGDPRKYWETFPFYVDTQHMMKFYKTLQFYSGLNTNARQELTSNHLTLSELLPLQQQEILYLLPQIHALAKAYPLEDLRLGWEVGPAGQTLMDKPSLKRLRVILPSPDPSPKPSSP